MSEKHGLTGNRFRKSSIEPAEIWSVLRVLRGTTNEQIEYEPYAVSAVLAASLPRRQRGAMELNVSQHGVDSLLATVRCRVAAHAYERTELKRNPGRSFEDQPRGGMVCGAAYMGWV